MTPDPASESSKPLFEPRIEVLIKTLGSGGPSLDPLWEGPYRVILSSSTAVNVPGIGSWVHHTRVKRWHPDQNSDSTTKPQSSRQYRTGTKTEI